MNYFILHGHFYQPPRENPWTGIIDRQESAYPYNDWNSRINAECYAASTRTPVLEHNEIVKMVNCFEYLSFNIGSTLFSWMDGKDPKTIERIIEGDRISRIKNGGHGNAIAQVYSHMIMPLASERDQYTQILWGLEDFKMRFGRDSEGIWLGETAINNETAAILVDCGIKYVILSPFQAGNIIIDGNKHNVVGGKVDPTQPYKLHTKHGELAIFFYDPGMASEISFGGALSDAKHLYGMVQYELSRQHKEIKLVHTATDGEVYGHHKRFGNMALAKLVYDQTINPSFEFTNYGYFLENHPPQLECELYLGEHGEGSSWSCAHGVGRWIRDCGCHTGGDDSWNQKWRTPLREAFDVLRDELYRVAESSTSDLIKDIWVARNDYLTPMVKKDKKYYDEFFSKHQKRILTPEEQKHVLTIMEALRYGMLTYTSCGWFFNDISGLEPIQDMLYAVRAYEFSKEFLDPAIIKKFRDILATAESNALKDNGLQILDKSVEKYKISRDSLIEYICWLIISGKTAKSNEFTIKVLSEDISKKQYIIRMIDTVGEQFDIACTLDDSNYSLFWKKISGSDVNWEESKKIWKISQISTLPLFLRIQFITQNIKHLTTDQSVHTLILNAAWNTEKLLLPYEKEMLSFHFTSQIHLFVRELQAQKVMDNVENFIRELELIKNLIPSDEEIKFYLEPLINYLETCMMTVILQKDVSLLRYARMVIWTVKKYIDPVRLDILRNIVYLFANSDLDNVEDEEFIIEFNILMKDMGFAIK